MNRLRRNLARRCWVVLAISALVGCTTANRNPRHTELSLETSVAAEIQVVLGQQVREWNAGNLSGFMETYARSDHTRFASGGDISLGWETVLQRYHRKYSDRSAMGTLTLSDLDVQALGSDAAVAFGRWHLKREHDEPAGLFTLILRKMPEGWRIVHDHTSAAENK